MHVPVPDDDDDDDDDNDDANKDDTEVLLMTTMMMMVYERKGEYDYCIIVVEQTHQKLYESKGLCSER